MTILYFQPSFKELNRREIEGVLLYARSVGWRVQVINYNPTVTDRLLTPFDAVQINLHDLFSYWKPAGCIIDCAGRDRHIFHVPGVEEVPVVYLDSHPDARPEDGMRHIVCSDNAAIAALAVRELTAPDIRHYAYLSWPEPLWWSDERKSFFEGMLNRQGMAVSTYQFEKMPSLPQPALLEWVSRLPRPCGVFAVNDLIGHAFVSAVVRAGYSVPGDFSVIGVDDDSHFCESCCVSLTSIRWNAEQAGFRSAEMLAQLIADPALAPMRTAVGEATVTHRSSTLRLKRFDERVSRALDFIRRNADTGLRPADVVAAMGCSRRLADLRFRESTGRTILQEIHAVRLERVRALLAQSRVALSSIPDQTGYKSLTDLQRVFKRQTGLTMREYRKALLISKSEV